MGFQLKITSFALNAAAVTEARAVEPVPRRPLPLSAVYLRPTGAADGFWLQEGDEKTFVVNNQNYVVYFGRKILRLPFDLELKKFTKVDYPGVETPMSFESRVKVSDLPDEVTISMNEPLKNQGFTIYQSSYDLKSAAVPISIFSVNRDPGRPIKYAGSLILAIGIVTFTLMRSRLGRQTKKVK